MTDPKRPVRIAMRREGDVVNAYWSSTKNMDDKVLLGSMRCTVLDLPGVWDDYQALMAKIGVALVENIGGLTVEGVEYCDAPEHEKAGNA